MFSRTLVSAWLLVASVSAQKLTFPDASPRATITQEVGISKVSIDYGSPAVKGREVWGKLVPYGFSKGVPWGSNIDFPWRAGANENTVITFSHDVKVEGKDLPAGSYGFHIIPSENEMTLIFSKNSTSWGSFYYDPKDDALRVSVKPAAGEFHENLMYGFKDLSNNSATVYLAWEKKVIPFKVEFDTKSNMMTSLRNEMRSGAGFVQTNMVQAANWCLANNTMLDEALNWVDRGILFGGGANLRFMKSAVLDAMGRKEEAAAMKKATLDAATEAEVNAYGYTLMGAKKTSDAIEVFEYNAKKNPKSWNTWDSLAEAQAATGNKKDAVANYKKAMQMTTDDTQKKRIQGILDGLAK